MPRRGYLFVYGSAEKRGWLWKAESKEALRSHLFKRSSHLTSKCYLAVDAFTTPQEISVLRYQAPEPLPSSSCSLISRTLDVDRSTSSKVKNTWADLIWYYEP